jgi:DNA topoisomerase I
VPGVTAKTFRTWGGTLAAFAVARETEGRLTIRAMAVAAAERLQNTPTIAKTSYIHPAVLALAELGLEARRELLGGLAAEGDPRLRAEERRLLAFLQRAA